MYLQLYRLRTYTKLKERNNFILSWFKVILLITSSKKYLSETSMLTWNAIGILSALDRIKAHQEEPCADKQFPSKEELNKAKLLLLFDQLR